MESEFRQLAESGTNELSLDTDVIGNPQMDIKKVELSSRGCIVYNWITVDNEGFDVEGSSSETLSANCVDYKQKQATGLTGT